MKRFIIFSQSEIHDISENLPVEAFIDGESVVFCSEEYYETQKREGDEK